MKDRHKWNKNPPVTHLNLLTIILNDKYGIVGSYEQKLLHRSISHFWDRPVPIFSDVRFSYLALVQDKKITCVLPANACYTVYVNCPPILHAFPF